MEMQTVKLDRDVALKLYRKYKEHRAYSKPIDREVQRTYQLIAQGKIVIKAIESIRVGGLNEQHLPRLALAPATAQACHIRRHANGSMVMAPSANFWHENKHVHRFANETFMFPPTSFPLAGWLRDGTRTTSSDHQAAMPIIPLDVRPRRGLENYHVLWEAEWKPIPPTDPVLLRRIGKADLWLVVAAWDLTEVERAALATRL